MVPAKLLAQFCRYGIPADRSMVRSFVASDHGDETMRAGMKLTTYDVLLIATIYLILIVGASVLWARQMEVYDGSEQVPLLSAVFIAACSATVFGSAFYIRKLYKDVFASLAPNALGAPSSRLATVLYFLTRPIFACLISVLSVIIMYEFVHMFSEGHVGVNDSFRLFATISSALIAIVTGAAVARIEAMARNGDSFIRPPV